MGITINMDINITNKGYQPNNVVIGPSEHIIWHNNDNRPHTVSASDGHSFDSAEIAPGTSYEFSFREKGIFGYYDKLNPDLQGEISISNIPPSE